MHALPNFHCPLCGALNQCAAAASGSTATACWCAEVVIPVETLARVPDQWRNKACLCPRCAGRPGAGSALNPQA